MTTEKSKKVNGIPVIEPTKEVDATKGKKTLINVERDNESTTMTLANSIIEMAAALFRRGGNSDGK